MAQNNPNQRRAMRCGYEPRNEHAPPGFPFGDTDRAETCPGYTTALPEVVEVANAYWQWKERTLEHWLEGPPVPEFLFGLAVLGNAINALEHQRAERRRQEAERGR